MSKQLRLEACLSPEPIKYTYDANFASCQTFCTKIFDANLLEMLNPEAVFDQSKKKSLAKWLLSTDDDWQELTREMERRFEDISTVNLPPVGVDLMKTYQESRVLLDCLPIIEMINCLAFCVIYHGSMDNMYHMYGELIAELIG